MAYDGVVVLKVRVDDIHGVDRDVEEDTDEVACEVALEDLVDPAAGGRQAVVSERDRSEHSWSGSRSQSGSGSGSGSRTRADRFADESCAGGGAH